jgi:hypothetical protein
MARGGYRPNSGPKKGTKYKTGKQKSDQKADIQAEAQAENLTPLEFMLKVMNNPNEDKDLRARMAVSAAPFCHARKVESTGKKSAAEERAKRASSGKFSPSKPPLRIVK